MYRRLSNLRLTRLISCSVTTKLIADEASAGWTTYGTAHAAFSLFQGDASAVNNSSANVRQTFQCALVFVTGLLAQAWANWKVCPTSRAAFSLFLLRCAAVMKIPFSKGCEGFALVDLTRLDEYALAIL
jgi:hypothetical protein